MNAIRNKDKWDSLSMKEKSDMMKAAVQQGIYNLSEIRKAYNEYAEGGLKNNGNPRPITTGGAGYVPSTDYSQMYSKLSNLFSYVKNYIINKINGAGDGEFIDLSDKNVSRIKSDTDNVSTILTNDFVEQNNRNTMRRKEDFVNTADTLLGDRKIPLSAISTFYGVEDGKLKAGSLETFNDSTTVIPNRTQKTGKIKKILLADKDAINKSRQVTDSVINKYNEEHGYKPTTLQKFYKVFGNDITPVATLYHNVGSRKATTIINENVPISEDFDKTYNRAVTVNGDTIPLPNINASPKVLFANENGNSAFVSNIRNNIDSLNEWLKTNPSYPIMVDNGRYSSYMTNYPNAEIYGGLNRPDDMFILGTTKKSLGGPLVQLANRYEEGGPYKPGTIYGRPVEKGLEIVSPEFDALLIGKVAANAAREAAGKLLNSGIEGTARQRAAITSKRFGREMTKKNDEIKKWSESLIDDVKTGNYNDVPLDLGALTRNVWETSRYIKNTPERYIENTLPRFYRNVFRRTYNNIKPAVPIIFDNSINEK